MISLLTYKVTADFLPFRSWIVQAESESEARLSIAQALGIPYEQTSAELTKEVAK
jgi:hypothetical protein